MGQLSKMRAAIPFDFVLEELAPLSPLTRPMFGCTAIYAGKKIVLIVRNKETDTQDNGVWIATVREHHESLLREFPSMRSIAVLGSGTTGWQLLPVDDPGFEESALRVCGLILKGDLRIGKVPKQKRLKPGRRLKSVKKRGKTTSALEINDRRKHTIAR
jgi:hypothetical protein